jgi:fucose permease
MSTNAAWKGPTPAAIAVVYGAAALQGLTLVSFPALSTVLKNELGFTDSQYGAIFLPQLALAAVGAVGGGVLARRLGLRLLLGLALLANALSQAFLAASGRLGPGLAFPAVLAGTACMGFGFGVSGAPLNSFPPLFFPQRRDTALVALHSLIGGGLAAGPLLAQPFLHGSIWAGFPLLLLGLCLVAAAATGRVPLPEVEDAPTAQGVGAPAERPVRTRLFWTFATIAVLYAFAEGTFSNWAVLYLHESKHLPEETAGLALSVFWAALVAGRLLVSVLLLRVGIYGIWLTLPVLMAAVFLLLPQADGAVLGIGLFAMAGLACSAFFPLSVALASRRFPDHVAWVSSMLIAALMVGTGLGSFVIGPLRQSLPLEQLYRLSTAYPVLAAVLALAVVRGDRTPG